ncbi:MAG TPA: hypothetical protein LFW20_03900 [Rickettsia endosymbiont of Omalisus fontisbellaquei]|nr:hypothetical protein [Rickettsia endosymbiont of Omalisus fontisbellaquei]
MKSQKQDSFTRGSQVFAHQVQMFVQGCINSFIVGLVLTVIWIIIRSCHKITYIGLYYFLIERYVQIKLLIGQFFYHTSRIGIKFYYLKKQKLVYCSAENFIDKFWLNTPYSKQVDGFSKFIIDVIRYEVPIILILGTIASIIFFIIKGRKQIATDFIRGGKLVEPKELAKMLYKAKTASSIKIGGLPSS